MIVRTNGQTFKEHTFNVMALSAQFAKEMSPDFYNDYAFVEKVTCAAFIHDIGKCTKTWQEGITNSSETMQEHYLHGPLLFVLLNEYNKNGLTKKNITELISYLHISLISAGHHAGLHNLKDGVNTYDSNNAKTNVVLSDKIKKAFELPQTLNELEDIKEKLNSSGLLVELNNTIKSFLDKPDKTAELLETYKNTYGAFAAAMMTKFLFSCLVDADRLDAEQSDSCKSQYRKRQNSIHERFSKMFNTFEQQYEEKRRAIKQSGLVKQEVCDIRDYVYEIASSSAEIPEYENSICSFAVPTGGGKTLSSLAFGLKHALKFKKRRIIYVIPYTSVISQTASEIRKFLNITENDNYQLLEHHSNFNNEEALKGVGGITYELASENWDADIIVTTNVQFFESLFSHSPSKNRRLHNIGNSVIIFDETQQIVPVHLIPCLESLKVLRDFFSCTIMLCTATLPTFERLESCKNDKRNILLPGFENGEIKSIIPNVESLAEKMYAIRKVTFFEMTANLNEKKTVFNPIYNEIFSPGIKGLTDWMLQSSNRAVKMFIKKNTRELYFSVVEALVKNNRQNELDTLFHLSRNMCSKHIDKTIAKIKEFQKNGIPVRLITTSLIECGVDISFKETATPIDSCDSMLQFGGGRCNRNGEYPEGGFTYFYRMERDGTNRDFISIDMIKVCHEATLNFIPNFSSIWRPSTQEKYFNAKYLGMKNYNKKKLKEMDAESALDMCKIFGIDGNYNMFVKQDGILKPNVDAFKFRTVGENFRLTDNKKTVTVYVKYDWANSTQQEKDAFERIKNDIANRNDYRIMQKYCVSLNLSDFKKLEEAEAIHKTNKLTFILSKAKFYNLNTGIVFS